MKSYLDLVFASARMRRRQNRMTILCIVMEVFLVTAIFSIADMLQRTQMDRMTDKNGSWHISMTGLMDAQAAEIAARQDVRAAGAMTLYNAGGEEPFRLNGKRVAIYGLDETALQLRAGEVYEGAFPQSDGEVLIGANTAKSAAAVSPAAAVSGGQQTAPVRHSVRPGGRSIEVALGVHHAMASPKNWLLMTDSYALSIVLALCFSVLLSSWQPDIVLGGYANASVIPRQMADELRALPGVKAVWGAASTAGVLLADTQAGVDTATICSYDDFMLQASRGELVRGTMPDTAAAANEVMTIYNKTNPLQVGDTVTVNGVSLTITGACASGLFSDEVTLVCPQALYDRLMGWQDYNLCGVLLESDVPDSTIAQIAALSTDEMIVTDERTSNAQTQATYLAVRIVLYSFLGIIGLIALLNIINSISMSVNARTRQYGAMRAVGMADSQLVRMIAAEGGGVCGLRVGRGAGGWPVAAADALYPADYPVLWHGLAAAAADDGPCRHVCSGVRRMGGAHPGGTDLPYADYGSYQRIIS